MNLQLVSRRIQRELKSFEIENNEQSRWRVKKLTDAQYYVWSVTMKGPLQSLYEKGTFDIEIRLPETYPIQPPKLKFLTKIFHPQVNTDGQVSLEALQNDRWTPALTIRSVLFIVQMALQEPDWFDFMNQEAADLLRHQPQKFKQKVQEWISKYADANH